MESYAIWLDRLTEAERRSVFRAATPNLRAEVIREIREGQWKAQLPEAMRRQLDAADPARHVDLIQKWKDEESERRRAWLLARRNWDSIKQNRVPWPFADKDGKRDVAEFVHTVLKIDGPVNGRLTPADAERLREAQDSAEKSGAWLWYGSLVRDLAAKYPTLPEPAAGKPVLTLGDFPSNFGKKSGDKKNLRKMEGKWPEFALAVAEDAAKANIRLSVSLGPSRPEQFREPLREFVSHGR